MRGILTFIEVDLNLSKCCSLLLVMGDASPFMYLIPRTIKLCMLCCVNCFNRNLRMLLLVILKDLREYLLIYFNPVCSIINPWCSSEFFKFCCRIKNCCNCVKIFFILICFAVIQSKFVMCLMKIRTESLLPENLLALKSFNWSLKMLEEWFINIKHFMHAWASHFWNECCHSIEWAQ